MCLDLKKGKLLDVKLPYDPVCLSVGRFHCDAPIIVAVVFDNCGLKSEREINTFFT